MAADNQKMQDLIKRYNDGNTIAHLSMVGMVSANSDLVNELDKDVMLNFVQNHPNLASTFLHAAVESGGTSSDLSQAISTMIQDQATSLEDVHKFAAATSEVSFDRAKQFFTDSIGFRVNSTLKATRSGTQDISSTMDRIVKIISTMPALMIKRVANFRHAGGAEIKTMNQFFGAVARAEPKTLMDMDRSFRNAGLEDPEVGLKVVAGKFRKAIDKGWKRHARSKLGFFGKLLSYVSKGYMNKKIDAFQRQADLQNPQAARQQVKQGEVRQAVDQASAPIGETPASKKVSEPVDRDTARAKFARMQQRWGGDAKAGETDAKADKTDAVQETKASDTLPDDKHGASDAPTKDMTEEKGYQHG